MTDNDIFTIIFGFILSILLLIFNKQLANRYRKNPIYCAKKGIDEKTIKSYEKMYVLMGLLGLVLVLIFLFTR